MTNEQKFNTVEERYAEFMKFCEGCTDCNKCELSKYSETGKCKYAWLELEYKKELKPCPFCGGKAQVDSFIHEGCEYHSVKCTKCHGRSIGNIIADESIAAWNRRSI